MRLTKTVGNTTPDLNINIAGFSGRLFVCGGSQYSERHINGKKLERSFSLFQFLLNFYLSSVISSLDEIF